MKDEIRLLKALADETRLKIILHLLNEEKCACTIVPSIGKAQPTVSGHLRILSEAGILASRRVKTNIYYKVKSKEAKKIIKLLDIKSG